MDTYSRPLFGIPGPARLFESGRFKGFVPPPVNEMEPPILAGTG